MSDSPARRNKRGDQTRLDLLDAALGLVESFTDNEILAALTPARVAAAAGRTTGSFFHHFPSRRGFLDALAGRIADEYGGTFYDDILSAVAELHPNDVPGIIRAGAEYSWQSAHGPERLPHGLISALSHAAPSTIRADGTPGTELFRDRVWGAHRAAMGPLYQGFIDSWQRSWVEPFDERLLTDVLAALEFGLIMMQRSGAEDISERAFSDVVLAIVVVATSPRDHPVRLADIEMSLMADGNSDDRPPPEISVDDVHWSKIGALFDGGGSVPLTSIAEVLDIDVMEAQALFGSARRAAALSVSAWIPGLMDAADRHLEEAPDRALADTVVDLARRARDQPYLAQALLAERAAAQLIEVAGGANGDILDQVQISRPIIKVLCATSPDVAAERRHADAAAVVDVALMLGSTRRRTSPADVAHMALGMLRN